MSVQIEILDYQYIKPNLVTWSNSSISNWNNGAGITSVINSAGSDGVYISTTAGVSGQYSGFFSNSFTLINNHSYTLSFKCSFLDNAGQPPSQVLIKGSGGGNANYKPISSPTVSVSSYEYTFTMDTSQNNNVGTMDIYFQMTNGNFADKKLKLKNLTLVDNSQNTTVDLTESLIGELDVTDHSEFPLSLTFQVSEIQKVTSTTGNYSKSFKIPATKNNNKILNNIYIPNLKRDNSPTENKKCRITIGNLFSLTGIIKVTGMGGYGENPSYYECVFYGNNLGWADGIEGKTLNDIEWGSAGENLLYNRTDISNTWNDVNCESSTSPIVYPVTSYGDFNPDGMDGTVQLLYSIFDSKGYGSTTAYYGFNNSGNSVGHPPPSPDWRPAVFVKDTLEKIFNQTNKGSYTLVSEFMDSDMFKQLVWLLPNFVYNDPDTRYDNNTTISKFRNGETLATNTFVTVNPPTLPLQVTDDGIDKFVVTANAADINDFLTGNGREVLDLTSSNLDVTLDENSNVDLTNNYVTIETHGYYEIELNDMQVKIARAYSNTSAMKNISKIIANINLEVQTVGSTSWNIFENASLEIEVKNGYGDYQTRLDKPVAAGYKDFDEIEIRRYFNAGDKIRLTKGLRVRNILGTTSINDDFIIYSFYRKKPEHTCSFNISFEGKRVDWGQTYNLKDVIDPKYTQMDFVKGIAHAFNLKMTTDDVSKIVTIEPATTFYKSFGNAIDWTHKLDRSREIQDKFLKTDLKRNIIFKYKSDDNDATVKYRGDTYFDGVHDEYPYRETLSSAFEKGESIFENPFFAGTYNARDKDTSYSSVSIFKGAPYSALLLTANTGSWTRIRPDKGYEFLPRLLHWNKYSPTITGQTGKVAWIQSSDTAGGSLRAGGTFPTGSFGVYPQATSYNREKEASPVLSYGNVYVKEYDDQAKTHASPKPVKGLYETYYKPIFEMFKYSPRLRTVYIDLKVTDVINLNFRKLIYIDGAYWRLNKIVDYMPISNKPTKVELVEWVELGSSFLPNRPPIGSGQYGGEFINESGSTVTTLDNSNQGL
tara:strand:+ start:346 stop:3486 length:3141 start_codon:yes stop_codon:yes gene_type:complete